jgi:DNA-binding beta-propeller fold protein YncE
VLAFPCISARAVTLSCANAGADELERAAPDSSRAPLEPDTIQVFRAEPTGDRLGAGELREPIGVAVDWRGFVYVADAMAGNVYRYSRDGESLEFARPPGNAAFYPIDIAVQESFILILDYSRNALVRYDFKGAYLDVLLSFDSFDSVRPVSVTAGAGGRILTTDIENHTVALWTPLLDLELMIGGFGWGEGRFNEPRKAAFLPDQEIVVVESGGKRLQFFSPSGRYERILLPPAGKAFGSPRSICADARGAVFVCDAERGRISVFSAGGSYLANIDSFEGTSISPAAAALGWDGDLYVADLKSRSILVYRLNYPRDE